MARIKLPILGLAVIAILVLTVCATQSQQRAQATTPPGAPQDYDALIHANANRMVEEGKQIFRFDTFGSEDFWGGVASTTTVALPRWQTSSRTMTTISI